MFFYDEICENSVVSILGPFYYKSIETNLPVVSKLNYTSHSEKKYLHTNPNPVCRCTVVCTYVCFMRIFATLRFRDVSLFCSLLLYSLCVYYSDVSRTLRFYDGRCEPRALQFFDWKRKRDDRGRFV